MDRYKIEMIPLSNNCYTAKIEYFDEKTQLSRTLYTNSKYNPVKEASEWADTIYEKDKKNFVVYGLGLGYHVRALKDKLTDEQKIYVLEANIEIHLKLKKYIKEECYDGILISNNIEEIGKFLNTIKGDSKLVIHQNMLELIPNEIKDLRDILSNLMVKRNKSIKYMKALNENIEYHKNSKDANIALLFDKMQGKTIIIVSAGPSLDKNVDLLSKINDQVIVFAVGRALKGLIKKNIRVDMFSIIDAQYEQTYRQIQGIEKLDIPLIYLNTANYKTVEKYKGPKYIAYNVDYPENYPGRIESGGSVATAVLDISIKLGGNPIIFIGQDLAYSNGMSHSKLTHTCDVHQQEKNGCLVKKVKGSNGNYLQTTPALLSYKHWIEQKILLHPDIKFYNCTEGGAYIEGCEDRTLLSVLEELKLLLTMY